MLKRTADGRVRVPAEQREALLVEFKGSGLSGAQFAKVVGMKYQTLMGWMARQRRRQASEVKGGQAEFVEAVVAKRGDSAAVRIDFGNGMTMHLEAGNQVHLAAQLIAALQKPC